MKKFSAFSFLGGHRPENDKGSRMRPALRVAAFSLLAAFLVPT